MIKNAKILLTLLTAGLSIVAGRAACADVAEEIVLRLKPSVVNIQKSVSHAFSDESPGRGRATGFIVDARRGIIATNRHVAGTSPARTKITFINGQSVSGRILHYDYFHDFAFYEVDPSEVDLQLRAAPLGDSYRLREQDEVVMIGNNDVEEYSVKFGRVTNLVVDKGDRHSATFQTSFDRAGGSSGSPVIDAEGQVVGIHFAGSSVTSFEMRIEYIRDALEQLRGNAGVKRGEIGLELELMSLSDAGEYFHLPAQASRRIRGLRNDIKRIIYVDRVVPGSPAEGYFQPGDLIVDVDGQPVGDDLYRLDRIVDGKVGQDVTITRFRNGETETVSLRVLDAEQLKVRRFALFAGGVFHDLNPELRRRYGIETDGLFMSQADLGTSVAEWGQASRSRPTSYEVVVEEVNGVATPDLDAFIEAVSNLKTDDKIYVLLRDLRTSWRLSRAKWVTLDLKFSPLRTFDYDPETLGWIEAGGESVDER